MYINRTLNKSDWNNLKQSSFDELKALKENILTMHVNIENKNIDAIQKFIHFNYSDITTSQLRNIYNLILDVPEKNPSLLSLKRVKLAYIAGRTDRSKKGMINLIELLDSLFESVGVDEHKLQGAKTFVEAVVAYHKFYDSLKIQHLKENKK